MQSLSAFTVIEVQPIVYCRSSGIGPSDLTWWQVINSDLFAWPEPYPVTRFAAAWDRRIQRRGGLIYARFRERLRQVATEALSYLKGVVVVHDFETLMRLLDCCDSYLIVPVDDDDWFSPNLGDRLRGLSLRDVSVVAWPDLCWWCSFDDSGCFTERLGSQTCDGHSVSAVGSNSYGITPRGVRRWGRDKLKELLDRHWVVAEQVPDDDIQFLQERLSLEIKHVGCTSVLTELVGKNYWWNNDVDISALPLWAKNDCDKVRELHTQLVTDMGGTFDRARLLRETADKTGS